VKLSLALFGPSVLVYIAFTFRVKMRQAFREVRSRLAGLHSFLAENLGGMALSSFSAGKTSGAVSPA
jgi:ATP-binding cassette subfamily B protein